MLTFTLIKQFILTLLAISVVQSRPLAEEIDAAGQHGERHSEPFGLVAIRSGSPLQYQFAVVSHGELFLSGNSSDPYTFAGSLFWDGSLKVLPDLTRFQPLGEGKDLFLSADNSSSLITSPKSDTSFAIKGGDLTYKGVNGFYAVPDNRYGYQYSLKTRSDNSDAIGIALRATTQSGGTPGDFPF